jgi:hypothetical protein
MGIGNEEKTDALSLRHWVRMLFTLSNSGTFQCLKDSSLDSATLDFLNSQDILS